MQFRINTYLGAVFAFVIVTTLGFSTIPGINDATTSYLASVFFKNSIETKDIIAQYDNATDKKEPSPEKVKILIVPGHDDTYGGAQIGSVREADLNLQLGIDIYNLLSKEKGIDVLLSRDKDGYNPAISPYITQNAEVLEFAAKKKGIMHRLIAAGKVQSNIVIHHNTARPEVVSILYGINKFANDNEYNIVLHINFNDYPGRKVIPGKYSGFSIYVPENQYSNADASYDFAKKLRDQFLLISAESDLPNEEAITEDQELIAVGSYNTLDSAVALVEYGYIYESQFTDPEIKDVIRKEFASQTHRGIMRYLKNTKEMDNETFASLDAQTLDEDLESGDAGVAVLALQDRLHDLGYYPPSNSLNVCPLSGRFAGCTVTALKKYQEDNNIPSTGIFGEKTRESLNK